MIRVISVMDLFRKSQPPPPRVVQVNSTAYQKTTCLPYLHPRLRGNVEDPYTYFKIIHKFKNSSLNMEAISNYVEPSNLIYLRSI
jgi:hypothetical protein